MFTHKKVIITGGSSGIGLEIARSVIGKGGQAVLIGRNREKLEQAVAELGPQATWHQLDVTDEDAVQTFFKNGDPFDHLVTAAAGTVRGKIVELPVAEARAAFESKFWGQYYFVKYGAPHMRKDGSVVLFSGWISRKPAVGISTLAAIDGAIESLARSLALELAPIRVNAITPGLINTPLWRARLSTEEQSSFFKSIGEGLPVGRAGRPEDIAHAVLFLIENGFTTGAILDIDGGQR